MKAMQISAFGDCHVFEAADIDKPQVKAGHALVRISATSVNPADYKIRTHGEQMPFAPNLPAVLGMDFAGTIEAIGDDVTDFSLGDEVYGCAGGLGDLPGALAEYIVADTRLIAKKPANLSMTEAAALPLVAITAYEGLMRAGIRKGQRVLVHGGTGGVGHIAVQLAKYFGAEVYATGGGDQQLEIIQTYGATGINYKTQNVEDYVVTHTNGNGFDIIFDSVGGDNLTASMTAAALNGHIATTVSTVNIDLTLAHIKGLSLHVVFMLIPMIHNQGREAHGQILKEIAQIVEQGELKPLLADKTFRLVDTASAHTYAQSGKAMGKVVIEI